MSTKKPRVAASAAGSFNSVPGAFEGIPEGLQHAFKMEFATEPEDQKGEYRSGREFRAPGLGLETTFSSDWFMLDLGAVDPSAIIAETVVRDCELVAKLLKDRPEEIQQLIEAFRPDAPFSEIESAIASAERIGFTEAASQQAGGGLLGLLVVAGAALLLGGCAHCNSHSKGKKTTPSR